MVGAIGGGITIRGRGRGRGREMGNSGNNGGRLGEWFGL
jgi:hypothetical protein